MQIKHFSPWLAQLFCLLLFPLVCSVAPASEHVTVSWDRNPEPDIAGYRLYYGTAAHPYSQLLDVADHSVEVSNLGAGKTYTFAVTAYNTSGAESLKSAPVSYTVRGAPSNESIVTLDNISSRVFVQTGENVLIGGFIVQSSKPKTVVLRAIGPPLIKAGVQGALADPVLELRSASGALIALNDRWNSSNAQDLENYGLAPTDDREAAIVATLPAGSYSAIIHGKGEAKGVALFELYNVDRAQGSLANISTRGRVEKGDNVMIGGFIIGGSSSTKVIVRAMGPSLEAEGIRGALQDPTLELYNGDGTLLSANDNWRSDQETAIVNSSVPPADDRESAIVATLAPGAYSAVLRGKNGTTGVALLEVYALGE
ncbi:MAG: fibronectin type III domain-containing protein [Rhodanobacteraceae bacterium]